MNISVRGLLISMLLLAACGSSGDNSPKAKAARASKSHFEAAPSETPLPTPIELAAVTSKVPGGPMADISGNLRYMLAVAMGHADWHGVTREQHLRVTAAVEVMEISSDGVDCVVEAALLDESGNLVALVRGKARVDGGSDEPAEHDALQAAAQHAARGLPDAARKAKSK